MIEITYMDVLTLVRLAIVGHAAAPGFIGYHIVSGRCVFAGDAPLPPGALGWCEFGLREGETLNAASYAHSMNTEYREISKAVYAALERTWANTVRTHNDADELGSATGGRLVDRGRAWQNHVYNFAFPSRLYYWTPKGTA